MPDAAGDRGRRGRVELAPDLRGAQGAAPHERGERRAVADDRAAHPAARGRHRRATRLRPPTAARSRSAYVQRLPRRRGERVEPHPGAAGVRRSAPCAFRARLRRCAAELRALRDDPLHARTRRAVHRRHVSAARAQPEARDVAVRRPEGVRVTDRGGTAPDSYETSGGRGALGEVALLRSQIASLEQLLDVHERTSIEQATRLEQTLREREELLARERAARDVLLETQAARDRALVAAKAERQRLYEIFMQAPAAIAVLEGPEHVFAVANPLYVELVGGRDVAGMTVRQALPEIEGQGFLDLLHTVYSSGEPYAASEMLVRLDRDQDGVLEDVYVDFVYQPMKTDRGETFGIMVHAVDVTGQVLSRREVEHKAEELARLTRDLERSNKELDQFAYVASHDLKAPLRGIANLTQWIEEDLGDKVTGESREHMQLLKGRVHRMEALIDGILAYSRAGRVRERPAPVDVGALLHEVVELLAPPPETTIVIAPDMPVIETERVPLQQVFMNLIGNAIKYTRRPDARIEVTAQAEGELYRFAIADNGPGIAPQYREKIWQIFQTLAPRDKVEGTGIGLSVVRKTVESRGGSAWLESEPGRGSTFYFPWPKQQDIIPCPPPPRPIR